MGQHIHPVPLVVSARTRLVDRSAVVGEMASILVLISAVLIAPLRRTGGREVIEDAGLIEAVVMHALPSNSVRGLGTPGWCAPPSQ